MDSEVEKAFNVFDKDQDGKITRTEIEELVANLGGDIKNPNFQVLFIRFHLLNVKISCSFQNLLKDSDNHHGIDKTQFMKFWKKINEERSQDDFESNEEILEAFKKYDTNGDGFITKDEITAVISQMTFVSDKEGEVEKCLKDMDANGDGIISYAEFLVKLKI